MIIDLILDRKDGQDYDARQFYNEIMEYGEIWPDIAHPIARAMDGGTNADVCLELCRYIEDQDYDPELKAWINEQNWIE